jgi:hypothetical protein
VRICLWYILAEPNSESARRFLAEIFPDLDLTPQGVWRKVIDLIETDAEDIDIHKTLAEEVGNYFTVPLKTW